MPTLIEKLSVNAAIKEAKAAASSFYTPEPISARMHEDQGMFSRTLIVTLEDGTETIVQLKDNELDLTKVALARSLLGDVVPDMHAAKSSKVYFAYVANLIPGSIWGDKKLSLDEDVRVVTQIARLLARCSLNIKSNGIVDQYILPRLHKILEKEDIPDDAIRMRIEKLCGVTDQLKQLPLCLCHIDVNARNIILNDNADVVGLVDWEQASLLPLGMNAWCIRTLSVPMPGGKDRPTDKSIPMAEAFWKEFTSANLPAELHRAVIIAMQVGFVLMNVFFEGGTPAPNVMEQFVERFDWLKSCFDALC